MSEVKNSFKPMESKPKPILIIGAGLAGLALALSLQKLSIPCTVYEARPKDVRLGGAVMLSPNALRVLDTLGAYARIKSKGYQFETLSMETDERIPMGTYYFGSEQMYGYKGLRIYRRELVHELIAMAEEAGVHMEFEKKYKRVISESEDNIEVEFDDGTIIDAAMLIGTDGIHSQVREYLAPGSKPKYLGQTAIAGAVKTSNVSLPADYKLPVSIAGKAGVFILAPQDIDGSELLAGTQYAVPELTYAESRAISSNPEKMIEMLRRDKADWSELVQSAMENMIPQSMYIWPFYAVPKIESWVSTHSKVVIIGDAAHAIPPTIGQGANQALEEALGLSILLGKGNHVGDLEKWTEHRSERIASLMEMTRKMNNNRLPKAQRDALEESQFWKPNKERPGEEMRWLYEYDVAKELHGLGL
ncbi:uncharacterized protein BP5553_02283 [Venustampulla echinocandica]|uniref:FAD-binding domain-containing protein n=1 Tax=Venustampulla echinocandica TaxID=2656787 RepID=A0A370U3G1_9HELO|nr:uncharacterized protein BP5553_02283 [Venustampulla echinocandica]RDL42304.1 hypothetical protein BP5553_02283 [Venustampulla echinocandica]